MSWLNPGHPHVADDVVFPAYKARAYPALAAFPARSAYQAGVHFGAESESESALSKYGVPLAWAAAVGLGLYALLGTSSPKYVSGRFAPR